MEINNTTKQLSDTILENLWCHLREQRPVTLYNTYHGVPVTYAADVAMVHPDYIGLITHPLQTACIKLERQTFIQSKGLPDLIRALPVSIDYTNRVVVVEKLKVPHVTNADLYHSWISPTQDVSVALDSEMGGSTSGAMMKLASLDENLFHVVVQVPDDVPFDRQDEIHLSFKLPESGDVVQMAGLVYSLTGLPEDEGRRLEVEVRAALQDEVALLAYIARREDALTSELEAIYMQLRKGKGLEA